MESNLLNISEAYLQAWNDKDVDQIARYVHPDVRFVGPMSQTTGKDAFLQGAKRMFGLLQEIKVQSKFASDSQAIFTYDFVCAQPIGVCRTAELITFTDGLISGVEIFFDARPFEKMMLAQKAAAASA